MIFDRFKELLARRTDATPLMRLIMFGGIGITLGLMYFTDWVILPAVVITITGLTVATMDLVRKRAR